MRFLLIACLLVVALAVPPAGAADVQWSRAPQSAPQALRLPFPRGERAAAVWDERACWSECGSYCAWGMASCLQRDEQGVCLQVTDRCDRYCQAQCRGRGGPFLNLAN